MKYSFTNRLLVIVLLGVSVQLAAQSPIRPNATKSPAKSSKAAPKLSAKKKFAIDVINSAVAIPQSDPQDRLRVLAAASGVAMAIQPSVARSLSKEGLRIEQDLIQRGEVPSASMMDSGAVDCTAVQSLVENVAVEKLDAAEQTLIGAVSRCSRTATTVERMIAQGIDKGITAPRLTMAMIEVSGDKSPWSQEQFEKLFDSLPSDPTKFANEGPNYASMYARMAPVVDADVAKRSGLKLLDWLSKLEEGGPRNLAVNVTTGAMKDVLKENYEKALESDVMARQIAQTAGAAGEVDTPPEESVSVLHAMEGTGHDRTAELNDMSPSQKAREAAASGFANGTQGDKKLATRYFDIAFSAVNDVWSNRSEGVDASAVVQEVSEAAAQVDPVNALQRAQHLQDPTAQAVGMIAVARVVASEETQTSAER